MEEMEEVHSNGHMFIQLLTWERFTLDLAQKLIIFKFNSATELLLFYHHNVVELVEEIEMHG